MVIKPRVKLCRLWHKRIMDAYLGKEMNNRRSLVIALGAGALAAPLASFTVPSTLLARADELIE